MHARTAVITGITGQDGSLLAAYLLSKKYHIIAPVRKGFDDKNLQTLGVSSNEQIQWIEYSGYDEFESLIRIHQPQEFYHLAAMSHVGEAHKQPEKVLEVNTQWTLKILQAITLHSPHTRMFFASTCEIFDKSKGRVLDENSPKSPKNPYGISKLAAHQLVEYYRNVKNIYACNAILFNHESEIRPETFVTQKVFKNVARIVKYGGAPLELGNVLAEKDWGYAPDFIPAFHAILQQSEADDFVLATGKLHSVQDLVDQSFESLGVKIIWSGKDEELTARDESGNCVVRINPEFYRPLDESGICGDWTRAKKQLNWHGSRPFKEWVAKLTKNHYRELK